MQQVARSLPERISALAQLSGASLASSTFQQQVNEADRRENDELRDERRRAAQASVEKAVKRAGVPMRFHAKRFDTFLATRAEQAMALSACRAYAGAWEQMAKSGVGMVLTGNPGNGKTHLAIAVLLEVMGRGHTGVFVSVSEMLRAIRATYSLRSERSEEQAFEAFVSPDLLVLDEVGVAIGDEEKRRAMVFDVLNARYNEMRPTILIGNLTADEMADYLGARVWDRVTEGGAPVISFTWESYRQLATSTARRT